MRTLSVYCVKFKALPIKQKRNGNRQNKFVRCKVWLRKTPQTFSCLAVYLLHHCVEDSFTDKFLGHLTLSRVECAQYSNPEEKNYSNIALGRNS